MELVQRIDKLMKERGIKSFAELEKLSGVSNGTISKWSKGVYCPTVKSLDKLSKYLRVSLNELTETQADFINLYLTGVKAWANNEFFSDEETAYIEDHFANLLSRYKELVNRTCDVRMNMGEQIDVEEIKKATEGYVYSLLVWLLNAPAYYFGKHSPYEKIFNVGSPYGWKEIREENGMKNCADELSEDEKELLEEFRTLDKKDKIIVLGKVYEIQKANETPQKEVTGGLDA
ncbi:MAG: helix-turn-helix domain-containing protein [Oscillospiraceae bacterium]|nr:helix-turn-helix domain-containing protein [Oscillospiraceae bacterium]